MSRQRRPASPSGRFPGERHQSARSPCRPRRERTKRRALRAGEVREDDCQILIVRIVRVRTGKSPLDGKRRAKKPEALRKLSAKTIKSETPPRQCISAPYSRLAYRRRKKTPTRHRPAPVFSTMPDHSKNPWHTPAWRQRSRPKAQQGAAKTCPHPPKGPSSGSARPRPYGSALPQEIIRILFRSGKRAKIGRQDARPPIRRKKLHVQIAFKAKAEDAVRAGRGLFPACSRRQCVNGFLQKRHVASLGELCGLPQRLVNHQTRIPQTCGMGPFPHGGVSFRHSSSWRSQRSTRLPRASISRCSASVGLQGTPFRFELLRDGRRSRRTCAQFIPKADLAVR